MFRQAFDLEKVQESIDALYQRLNDISTEDNDWILYLKERQVVEERYLVELKNLKFGNTDQIIEQHKILSNHLGRILNAYKESIERHQDWKIVYDSFSQKKPKYQVSLVKLTKDYLDKLQKQRKLNPNSSEKKANQLSTEIDTLKLNWEKEMVDLLDRIGELEPFRLGVYHSSLLDYTACFHEFTTQLQHISTRASLQLHDTVPSKQFVEILKQIATNDQFDPVVYLDQGDSALSTPHSVDSEGYSIRPDVQDPFKTDDDTTSKFKVAIQDTVIQEDEESTKNVMTSVAAQLQSEASSLRRIPRTRTGSVMSNGSSLKPDGISPKAFNHALAPILSETFEDPKPNYSISIIETVNVYLNQGEIEKILVTGEISVTVSSVDSATQKSIFEIQNVQELEKIIVNPTFARQGEKMGVIELLMPQLAQFVNTPVPILKYQVSAANVKLPLKYKPMWKRTDTETNLLIQLDRSPVFSTTQIVDLELFVQVKADQITNVQTNPIANWDLETRTLLWNLRQSDSSFLVAKIESPLVTPEASRLRFNIKDCLLSKIEVVGPEITLISKAIQSGTFGAMNQMLE